ncbi:MAG: hypothetical protein WCD79_00925 [Chthoniobacteraceae bacterium]
MIRFRYEPTFRDYREFSLYAIFRGFRPYLLTVGIVLLFLFLAYPIYFPVPGNKASLSQIYVSNFRILLFPVVLTAMMNWRMRKRWNASPDLRIAKEYEFDNSGIRAKGEDLSGFNSWSTFKLADFDGKYFFLKTRQNLYYYFPASVVSEKRALVRLVGGNVKVSGRWEKLKSSSGANGSVSKEAVK